MVARAGWGGVRSMKGIKRYKLLAIKQVRHKDEKDTIRNTVNNVVW